MRLVSLRLSMTLKELPVFFGGMVRKPGAAFGRGRRSGAGVLGAALGNPRPILEAGRAGMAAGLCLPVRISPL
jgi:hypothetical protein